MLILHTPLDKWVRDSLSKFQIQWVLISDKIWFDVIGVLEIFRGIIEECDFSLKWHTLRRQYHCGWNTVVRWCQYHRLTSWNWKTSWIIMIIWWFLNNWMKRFSLVRVGFSISLSNYHFTLAISFAGLKKYNFFSCESLWILTPCYFPQEISNNILWLNDFYPVQICQHE